MQNSEFKLKDLHRPFSANEIESLKEFMRELAVEAVEATKEETSGLHRDIQQRIASLEEIMLKIKPYLDKFEREKIQAEENLELGKKVVRWSGYLTALGIIGYTASWLIKLLINVKP